MPQPTFEDFAAAVSIAASRLKYDLDQVELLAARINLSPMGEALATTEIKKTLASLVQAHQFFHGNSAIEADLRAFAQRKSGRWPFRLFTGAAA